MWDTNLGGVVLPTAARLLGKHRPLHLGVSGAVVLSMAWPPGQETGKDSLTIKFANHTVVFGMPAKILVQPVLSADGSSSPPPQEFRDTPCVKALLGGGCRDVGMWG